MRIGNVYVDIMDDCCENNGGYWCKIYKDEDMNIEADDFCIHPKELTLNPDPIFWAIAYVNNTYAECEKTLQEYNEVRHRMLDEPIDALKYTDKKYGEASIWDYEDWLMGIELEDDCDFDRWDEMLEEDEDKYMSGGISFMGETVQDFVAELDNQNITLNELNKSLVECGIKPIMLRFIDVL